MTGGARRLRSCSTLVAVLLVWLALQIGAHVFVASYALEFPFMDDWSIGNVIQPSLRQTLENLWSPYNEHRIPLPRLVQFLLYELTGDIRSAMHADVVILGALSLALIALARRLRGASSLADAFFPLLWLHLGNCENLLMGFQIAIELPTALVCVVLMAAAVSRERPRPGRALACGLSLACLPLCGGAGITQAPALGAWLLWTGWTGRRSADPRERSGAKILLASVVACGVMCLAYAWDFEAPPDKAHYSLSPAHLLGGSQAVLAWALGPAAETYWPASAVLVLGACATAIALLLGRLRNEPAERVRASGILASIAGTLALAAAISFGRVETKWSDVFALRYVTLTAPILCAAFLAWSLYGGRWGRILACAVLGLSIAAVFPENLRIGQWYGELRRSRGRELESAIERDAPPEELVQIYEHYFLPGFPDVCRALLMRFAAERAPPFDRGGGPPPSAFDFPMFRVLPSKVESGAPTAHRNIAGEEVLLVRGGTRIHFWLSGDEKRIAGRFWIPTELVEHERSGGMRVLVELSSGDGPAVELYGRSLDPLAVESDRGEQSFDLQIPPHAKGEIVLRTESLVEGRETWSWLYWTGVVIE